ncbi:uncharacterized protein [Antedon mediterranea]|uniref:uncharacterized protein n=1 Tax=Antedon mediterranea TaxID=105859 RepID=UPI003AF423AF
MKSSQSAWVLIFICLLIVLLCQMCSSQHHTTGRDRNVNKANRWKSGKRTQPSTETQETLMKVRRAQSARVLAKLLKDYAEKVMFDSDGDYIQRHHAGDNQEYYSGFDPRWYEG